MVSAAVVCLRLDALPCRDNMPAMPRSRRNARGVREAVSPESSSFRNSVLFLLLPLAIAAWPLRLEAADASPSASKDAARRHNILWIMCDQLRYDCVGANGNKII